MEKKIGRPWPFLAGSFGHGVNKEGGEWLTTGLTTPTRSRFETLSMPQWRGV